MDKISVKGIIFGVLFLFFCVPGFCGNRGAEMRDSIVGRINTQIYNFPQEKIHVTTDRSHYIGGDTIWFRAFVVDAITHEPVKTSKYVYAELKSPFDSLECRIKVMERDGVFKGYIPLDVKIAEGDYTLSAYTMFMENLGEKYFFKKSIDITSPFATQTEIKTGFNFEKGGNDYPDLRVNLSYCDRQSGKLKPYEGMFYTQSDGKSYRKQKGNKPVNIRLSGEEARSGYLFVAFKNYRKYIRLPRAASEKLAVTFHPEGGYLIPNKAGKVAFKAINTQGLGEDISGTIVDSRGTKITEFASEHAGMGVFSFVPTEGETYRAVTSKGEFELPQANSNATVVKVGYPNKRQISIGVQSTRDIADDLNIVVMQRGKVLYCEPYKTEITLDRDDFQPGILQVLLIDSRYNVLSERMLFIRNSNAQKAECTTDKETYGNREKVEVAVTLDGYTLPQGNYAVSVTDNKTVDASADMNIETELLLNSDLSGNIESPNYYFSSTDSKTDMALDALMLSQGWKRYDIPQVVKGIYTEPLYPMEIGQEISGTVRSKWKNKELSNAAVSIISPKVQFANIVKTDKNGRFSCNGFNYPDGTKFIVQAFNSKGTKEMNIKIDEPGFPQVSVLPIHFKQDLISKDFIAEETERLKYNSNLKMVLLDEITVSARPLKVPEDIFEALSTKTYGYEELEKKGITSIEEVLRGIAGIVVSNGYIKYRGGNVVIFIDGVPVDEPIMIDQALSNGGHTYLKELEERIPFDFIKRIDFLKPNEAVVLGPRAASGALMIKTKEGSELKAYKHLSEIIINNPLGYQKPVEFYSPKYLVNSTNSGDIDLRSTVYWNPSVQVSDKGVSAFDFFTSDVKYTGYTITIEGITQSGDIIKTTNQVVVSEAR